MIFKEWKSEDVPFENGIVNDGTVIHEKFDEFLQFKVLDSAIRKTYFMAEQDLYPESMKIKDLFKWTKEFYKNFDMDYYNNFKELINKNQISDESILKIIEDINLKKDLKVNL